MSAPPFTADTIAIAVVAAARDAGLDPIDVLGQSPPPGSAPLKAGVAVALAQECGRPQSKAMRVLGLCSGSVASWKQHSKEGGPFWRALDAASVALLRA